MQTIRGIAEVNGTRLHYEVCGKGKPLVLIHGNTLNLRMWDDQLSAFAEHFQVIRYDMRGYGKSSLPSGLPYSHCEDTRALLDHLNIEKAHILGLSLGGAVALDFVIANPELTLSFISVDGALSGFHWTAFRQFFANVMEARQREGLEAARQAWLEGPLFAPALAQPHVAPKLRAIVGGFSGWIWNGDPSLSEQPLRAIDALEDIRCPTLSIVGELDLPEFHEISQTLARRIPGARRITLPNVGHMCNMEDPELFNETVLAFLHDIT